MQHQFSINIDLDPSIFFLYVSILMALLSDTIPTYCSFLDSGLFVS